MIDKERARLDPSLIFKTPKEVLKNNELTRDEKVDILKRWAYDERELSVAEDENMLGSNNASQLDEIIRALLKLGNKFQEDEIPPTKHG